MAVTKYQGSYSNKYEVQKKAQCTSNIIRMSKDFKSTFMSNEENTNVAMMHVFKKILQQENGGQEKT